MFQIVDIIVTFNNMHRIQANIILKNDKVYELNKKSFELHMRIKEFNQKEVKYLNDTLTMINLKKKYKMDTYQKAEKDFINRVRKLQEKFKKIESHLNSKQINEIRKKQVGQEPKWITKKVHFKGFEISIDSKKSIYSRVSSHFNHEKRYKQDWVYINKLTLGTDYHKELTEEDDDEENNIRINELNLTSSHDGHSSKDTLESSSTISLPSIISECSEKHNLKKVNYDDVYHYKKYYLSRREYEIKADQLSKVNFSCYKTNQFHTNLV